MSSRGSLQRKCVKGHPKADGRCSGRCIRWYPRLELPRGPDGKRRFEALGGYPTRTQAEATLADALARHAHGLTLDPAKLTVNQYLDRWLAHIRTSLRARTVARYTTLLRDHGRPDIGARPFRQLTPLEVQAIYDRLAVSGRRDGKPGALAPQHILAVHRCLHRALAQAVTTSPASSAPPWRTRWSEPASRCRRWPRASWSRPAQTALASRVPKRSIVWVAHAGRHHEDDPEPPDHHRHEMPREESHLLRSRARQWATHVGRRARRARSAVWRGRMHRAGHDLLVWQPMRRRPACMPARQR
jgi:Phage integrase, N-terminal SAM-like domain